MLPSLTSNEISLKSIYDGNTKEIKLENSSFTIKTPGLYIINDTYPIVIKSEIPKEITIVYPFINNYLYEKVDGETRINTFTDSLDIDLYSTFTHIDANFFDWMQDRSYTVISENDLLDLKYFGNTKYLILYGTLNYLNQEIMNNLIQFVDSGGNILVMCPLFCEYNIEFSNKSIIKQKDTLGNWKKPKPKIPLHYSYGGKTDGCLKLNHEKISAKELCLINEVWSSAYWGDTNYTHKELGIQKLTETENNKGKGYLTVSTSKVSNGKLILIGSDAIFWDENYKKQEIKKFLNELFLLFTEP